MRKQPGFLKRGEPLRLQSFLARSGLSSRRGAEEMIEHGRVRVNGETVTAQGMRIVAGVDRVELDGVEVKVAPTTWLALHKPTGYVTTRTDPYGRRTVYDLIPDKYHGLFHVGRLDRDSEGILLLTNDGDLANRFLHPSFGITKEYDVIATGKPSDAVLRSLVEGIELEDGIASAESARLIGPAGNGLSRLKLVLKEGKKREVRRMLEAVGHPVKRLVRRRFGPIELGELPEGKWRIVQDEELAHVRDASPMKQKPATKKRDIDGHAAERAAADKPARTRAAADKKAPRTKPAAPKRPLTRREEGDFAFPPRGRAAAEPAEAPVRHEIPSIDWDADEWGGPETKPKRKPAATRATSPERPAARAELPAARAGSDRPAARGASDRPAPRGASDRPAPRGDRPPPRGGADRPAPRSRPADRDSRPTPRGAFADRGDRPAKSGKFADKDDRPAPRSRPADRGGFDERDDRPAPRSRPADRGGFGDREDRPAPRGRPADRGGSGDREDRPAPRGRPADRGGFGDREDRPAPRGKPADRGGFGDREDRPAARGRPADRDDRPRGAPADRGDRPAPRGRGKTGDAGPTRSWSRSPEDRNHDPERAPRGRPADDGPRSRPGRPAPHGRGDQDDRPARPGKTGPARPRDGGDERPARPPRSGGPAGGKPGGGKPSGGKPGGRPSGPGGRKPGGKGPGARGGKPRGR